MKYEVEVKNSWVSSKTIHLTVEAEDEDEARLEALSDARSSHPDDWGDTHTNEFQEEVEEITIVE